MKNERPSCGDPAGVPATLAYPRVAHLSAPWGDRGGEAAVAERGDDQPPARVGRIRLGMAGRTGRHQAVEIKVRAGPWAGLITWWTSRAP
jgi:hypothetical protein